MDEILFWFIKFTGGKKFSKTLASKQNISIIYSTQFLSFDWVPKLYIYKLKEIKI